MAMEDRAVQVEEAKQRVLRVVPVFTVRGTTGLQAQGVGQVPLAVEVVLAALVLYPMAGQE
jgi:hypothetical protein